MGRCACGTTTNNDTCACALGSSDAIAVTGTGNIGDPYIPAQILDPDDGNTGSVSGAGLLVPGMLAATSAARPGLAPASGVRVQLYETDTDLTWVWNGSDWVRAFGKGLLDVGRRVTTYSNATTSATVVVATGTIHIPDGLRPVQVTVSWPNIRNDNAVSVMGITRSLPDDTGINTIARWNNDSLAGLGGSYVAYEEDGVAEGDYVYHLVARPDTTLGGTTTIDADSDDQVVIAVTEL